MHEKIATTHPLFADSQDRVNWENNSIQKGSTYITTLDAIRSVAEIFLLATDPDSYEKWKPLFKEQVPIRPTEEEIEKGCNDLAKLYDLMSELKVFQDIMRGESVIELREFSDDSSPDRTGHMMLRPVGQQVFALAVSSVLEENILPSEEIKHHLKKIEARGDFALSNPANLWYKILFNPDKTAVIVSSPNRDLAASLLEYLIVGANNQIREELIAMIRQRRLDETGHMWMDFDGQWTERTPSASDLPIPS